MSDNLKTVFKKLEGSFDIETPTSGHEDRFLSKLKQHNAQTITLKSQKSNFWKPLLTIAATVVICFGIFSYFNNQIGYKELSSVSPEMAEAQTFFTNTITTELSKLNSEETPEFQELIVDALFEIKILEEDYKQLTLGLNERPDDELIISAMILNFQKRIDILQDVMFEIDELKKTYTNQTII